MNAPATFNGATALVTGASGFIGSHLVDALVEAGCRVHCLVRPTSDLRWIPESKVQVHRGHLDQPEAWQVALAESQFVFHCAGLTVGRNRREYFSINAGLCRPFYEACLPYASNLKGVVHLSSLAAVGPATPGQPVNESTLCNPVTYYGKSKRAGEQIALEYADRLPLVVLRPPVVYGEREQNFFTYLQTLKKGWALRIGRETRTLSLIQVQDMVEAMLTAAAHPANPDSRVFFTTDGRVYSWEEVGETAARLLGVHPRSLCLPVGLLSFAALLSGSWARIRNRAALLDRQRVLDIRQSSWTADSGLFFEQYNFTPRYNLEQGLKVTLNWYRQQGWL